jgi:molybdopterin synthase catalytic subunit
LRPGKEIKRTIMTEKKPKNVFVEGAISSSFIAEAIGKHSTKKNIGAHSIFLGQVRDDLIDHKAVKAIDYSAYHEMAEDAFLKFSLTCMHVYHSVGRVMAGEICLFVFTSSVHRKQAIEACNYIVNRIKEEVPVWGKEIFEDESYVWKENK